MRDHCISFLLLCLSLVPPQPTAPPGMCVWGGGYMHMYILAHAKTLGVFKVRLIKTQRETLGFNLKVRKVEQLATGFYLYLSSKIVILLPRISE